jgi:hypothetical protein
LQVCGCKGRGERGVVCRLAFKYDESCAL